MSRKLLLDFIIVHFPPELLLHGGNGLVIDPTRDDMSEIRKVGIHIQGQPMHRHPSAGLHSKCSNLSRFLRFIPIQPDTGQPIDSTRLDAILGHGPYDGLFQISHVTMDVGEELL